MASLAKKQYRAEEIVRFFLAHECNRRVTLDHFKQQKINHMTIRRAIDRYETTGSSNFRPITGRPTAQTTMTATGVIRRLCNKDPSISVRSLATKANISRATCARVKRDLGGKTYKQKVAPKMIKDQEKRIISGARDIYKQIVPSGGGKILVADDESYIPLDPSQVPGPSFYTEFEGRPVDDKWKFKGKQKFCKKFLIWIAHDSEGNFSDPYVMKGTMNAQCYLKNCIKRRLLPFIQRHHPIDKVLFWPDLATIHYANDVTTYLDEQDIQFVRKENNTPNFPQGRPIEKFWALVKSRYKRVSRPPKNLKSFKVTITRICRQIASESGKNLVAGWNSKLINAYTNGPLNILKVRLPTLNKQANSIQ